MKLFFDQKFFSGYIFWPPLNLPWLANNLQSVVSITFCIALAEGGGTFTHIKNIKLRQKPFWFLFCLTFFPRQLDPCWPTNFVLEIIQEACRVKSIPFAAKYTRTKAFLINKACCESNKQKQLFVHSCLGSHNTAKSDSRVVLTKSGLWRTTCEHT